MPDDNYRSTHGLPPDSRPTNVPPDWWSLLERDDLPEGQADLNRGASEGWGREEIPGRTVWGRGHYWRARPHWRVLIANISLMLLASLLLVVGIGYTNPKGVAAVLLGCAVLALLVVMGVQVARRIGRHRW